MPRAARAHQRGPVEIEVDARVGSHSSAPRLAGLMTVGRRGLNRDGAKWTGHRPITLSSSPPPSPSPSPLQPSRSPIVRAMRLAGPGWAMQTYAGRASPSKIPGWIESHAIRQRMQSWLLHLPILEILILILGFLPPVDPTAGRFCFGINKNLSVAAFGQGSQQQLTLG